jgi:hypothetical protein
VDDLRGLDAHGLEGVLEGLPVGGFSMTFRVVGPSSKLIRVAQASKVTISRMGFSLDAG